MVKNGLFAILSFQSKISIIPVSGKGQDLFALLTELICNTAGGFACRLAGSLALAAAARLQGVL